MLGRRWLPRINNLTSGSNSAPSDKQEQEMSPGFRWSGGNASRRRCALVGLTTLGLLLLVSCVTLSVLYKSASDSRPAWENLLFDYQNISDSFLTLSRDNHHLRGDNRVLQEQSAWLDQQARLLNRTSAGLMTVNLALSSESGELMGRIVNLTSANLHLTQELERLVRYSSELEEEKLNMSRTIRLLVASDALREQEERRLSETNGLLMDEVFELRAENRDLLEINGRFQAEVKNLSEQVGALLDREETAVQLQQQNQNLSDLLASERQAAAEREGSWRNETDRRTTELLSVKEAYRSLDLYCPVVHHGTKERVCRKCPDGWRLFDSRCYYLSSQTLSWSSSRSWCQTQGGDLLVVDGEAEQSFVMESSRVVDQGGSRFWIGLTDAQQEGDWLWVDGRSVASDAQFWLSRPGGPTEPDDWRQDDPLGEDCGHIDAGETALTSWMDGSCSAAYRWICEKKV